MRLAILASHPIQYYAPLFRDLAKTLDIHVFFSHLATPKQQAAAGFSEPFDWDVDLVSGYSHSFLRNVSQRPGTDHFSGCDTPEIDQRLRDGRFDALLVFGWHLKTFFQAIVAAKRRRLPVVVRGDSQLQTPRSPVKKVAKTLAYPPFLRLFDAALYVGERSRAYYEHYRYPADRLFFSPHCVDSDWFAAQATPSAGGKLRAEHGIPEGAKVLLFAGKFVPFKRPIDVVEAAALCRKQGQRVEVMMAGSGELAAELASRSRSCGVPVHLLGFRNQTEMPAAYAASDILVLPSTGRETWGLVANESLACGRPVVVSDACGCAPDLAGDRTAGRAFPAGDVDGLSKAVIDILDEPPSRDAIARKSRRYSVSSAIQGIRAAIDEVAVNDE